MICQYLLEEMLSVFQFKFLALRQKVSGDAGLCESCVCY